MIFTSLHHLSSVHSILYHSYSFSHLNLLECPILVTFSSQFSFYFLEIFSLIHDLFLVSLPSICALLTSGRSLILIAVPLLQTWLIPMTLIYLLLLKLGFLFTLPLLNYLMLYNPHGFTFINTSRTVPDALRQSLVVAQHFYSVNLPNCSPHLLLLLLNHLNCLQSQSSFLTLIWLYI